MKNRVKYVAALIGITAHLSGLQAQDISYFKGGQLFIDGYRQGTQSKQPLQVVVSNPQKYSGTLPEQYTFASVAGEGIVISTVKKCNDDDSVILRGYDMEGNDADATFHLFKEIQTAGHTNPIEEEPVALPSSGHDFSCKIGHHAIETFKIQLKNQER
jgi:alpha-mannosidase